MEEDSDRSILSKLFSRLKKHHLQNGSDITEEINELMDEGQAKGLITGEESEMVHGVLELKETTASSIMIPRTDLSSASIDSTLDELLQLGQAGHGPVLVHDLAEYARGLHAGQAGQVGDALGLARALQCAPGHGAQGKDMPRPRQVGGLGIVRDRHLDRARPVEGRNAGGDAVAGIHRNRKRRACQDSSRSRMRRKPSASPRARYSSTFRRCPRGTSEPATAAYRPPSMVL